MKPLVGACAVSILGISQIALSCAVSAVIGRYLYGSFPLPESDYAAKCGLSMTSTAPCTAGFVTTAVTIVLCMLILGIQCASMDAQKHGFWGPILSIFGLIWWAAYSGAATTAARTGNHWDPQHELTSYRTAVVAMSWCTCALFLPSLIVSAVTVSAAARANSKLAKGLNSSGRRYSQPQPSPPVSPVKGGKSHKGAYDPFQESASPKKWVQPHNTNSGRYAVTSDGHRTLFVVAGTAVPLSPSTSVRNSPAGSPARSPLARSLQSHSPDARSPMHRNSTLGSAGSFGFTNVLLVQDPSQLSSHPTHA